MMTQEEALLVLKTGANVFLTGEPGSGKTHTVNAYVAWLRERGIEPAITASTGIAATHIGGFTIHSWSGIGVRRALSEQDLDAISQNRNVVRRIAHTAVLIIDEVSMLSASTLSMVDAVCREVRRTSQPFGGLQVIVVGDFFQLPPVSRSIGAADLHAENQAGMFGGADGDAENGHFAFHAPAWHALGPLVCYLSEQHRQEDPVFLELLSALRKGTFTEAHRALLKERALGTQKRGAAAPVTQLYAHNANVDAINDAELSKLSAQARTFTMESRGPEKLVDALKRGCLSPERLVLKEGARVMFTRNDIVRQRYVNGTLGTVVGFETGTGYPLVETTTGRTIAAAPDEWRIEDGGRVLAAVTQVPLRLAWAITVHKSQGMSLDAAHMDLSRAFEYGQGYVALSRVRTLAGLSVSGFNERALEVHPDVLFKDAEFRRFSEETCGAFAQLSADELLTMQSNFIRACGGTEPGAETGSAGKSRSLRSVSRKKRENKKKTAHVTREHIKNGMTLAEIAAKRGLKAQTIIAHVQKLLDEGPMSRSDIGPLAAGEEEAISIIHEAFRELGTETLKPIFEHFNGAYPYDTIRLALLLYDGQ